ncbi:hypothetical protein BGZ76_006441 [Entomortierella beljakovae]|nr:hypothetical protein BGZ76_006441 [Entomortierella beljakovae]
MSFHIGILVVIVSTRSEYEPLGSSEGEDTRASEERLPWYFEEEESVQRTESGIQLQHNVATTRSLDCV